MVWHVCICVHTGFMLDMGMFHCAHCDQDAGLFGQGHISLLVASFFKQLGIGGSFVNMEHSSGTILMPHTVKECCTLALFPGST